MSTSSAQEITHLLPRGINRSSAAAFPSVHARTRFHLALVSLVLLAIGLGVFLFLLLSKMNAVEGQMQVVTEQVQKAVARGEEAAEESRQARLRASQAEENALKALRAREEAILQRREAEQAAQAAQDETAALRARQQAELDRLQQALSRIVETRRTALGVVMSLGNDSLRFDFNKATLRPENREILSRIAGILQASPDFRIDVYGHTDDIGSEEYNQALSERRAQAVRDYLVEAGIDPSVISTEGFGKSRPRVPGTTPENRAKNRRVEIAVVNTRIADLRVADQ